MAQRAVFLKSDGTTYEDICCRPLREAVDRGSVQFAALARHGYPGEQLPAKVLPRVKTLGWWDARQHQDWGLEWHRDTGIEITYVSQGRTMFGVDRRYYALNRDVVAITRPWQWHCIGQPHVAAAKLHWLILDINALQPHQPWRWPDWLLFSPDHLQRLTDLLRHNEQPVRPASPAIHQSFLNLAQQVGNSRQPADITRTTFHLNELLIALYDLLEKEDAALDERLSTSYHTVRVFLQSLPDHLDQPWTIPAMARECGLGRTRFTEYCHQIVNMAPSAYLTRCRLETASQMLRDQPRTSITDIALTCGFNTSQYFATVFRQTYGISPATYRNQPPAPGSTPGPGSSSENPPTSTAQAPREFPAGP